MYIRETKHKNSKTKKEYSTFKLVESVQTLKGPRQRTIINLGADFDLPKPVWKDLVTRIEEIISGQKPFVSYPQDIETLAQRYARKILKQEAQETQHLSKAAEKLADYHTVDIKSLKHFNQGTIGAEFLIYKMIQE